MKLLLVIIYVICTEACSNSSSLPLKTGREGDSLPSFDLLLMDGVKRVNTDIFNKGRAVVLLYVNPECPYCRAETEDITANMSSIDDIQFCIIAYAPFDRLKSYYEKYNLEKYSNIVVGLDYNAFLEKYFNIESVPYMAIYGTDGRMKRAVVGTIGPKSIRSIIYME